MKVVVYGSRSLPRHDDIIFPALDHALDLIKSKDYWGIDNSFVEVVSGGARGADHAGERWAMEREFSIKRFYPNWKLLGKRAGLVRNVEMSKYADCGIELWDGKSRGTSHMREQMMGWEEKTGMSKPVFGYNFGFRIWNSDDTDGDGWLIM